MENKEIIEKITTAESSEKLIDFVDSLTPSEIAGVASEFNKAYRLGTPIVSDFIYDLITDTLTEKDPHNPFLSIVGFMDDSDERKEKLPIEMASMNKVKTYEALLKWMTLKGIPLDTVLILTPKYDGLSLCSIEAKTQAWTRGDGIFGRRSHEHLEILLKGKKSNVPDSLISFGEVILPLNKWGDYEDSFANPRNMASGQLNNDVPEPPLEDFVYMRYGLNIEISDKDKQLDVCNKLNEIQVPYIKTTIDTLSDGSLKALYEKWKVEFEIDGIIVEVNDAKLRQQLGRETSTQNPCFARAYKGSFEEVKETTMDKPIEWGVSKQGYLNPVGLVAPVKLDGATVSRTTLYNAKTVKALGLGEGAKILIKRSGKVIPFVVSVIVKSTEALPTVCPSCGMPVEWNSNRVHLVCNNADCDEKRLNKIISFFKILEVKNVSKGICKQLYDAGYNSIEKILKMTQDDYTTLEKFADRKAEIVFKNIQSKMHNITLSKLQHASGCFGSLGSKKLKLLEHFKTVPTMDEVLAIDGFAGKSVDDYLLGLDCFNAFIKDLPVRLKVEEKPISDKYKDLLVVFSGIRRKDLEETIVKNGGRIGDSVSKNTTHVIMKQKGSGSAKEEKAIKLGVTIWEVTDLEGFLKL